MVVLVSDITKSNWLSYVANIARKKKMWCIFQVDSTLT